MELSSELLSQFAKVTNDSTKPSTESTVYGTVVMYEGKKYVKLDGSDQLTPVETTVAVEEEERVMVSIKNHTATITGNLSDPSASSKNVEDLSDKIDEFGIIIADKVLTDEMVAEIAKIGDLEADNATIKETLTANSADITDLQADVAEINTLKASKAEIDELVTTKVEAEIADVGILTAKDLEAVNADIHNLEADYGDFKQLSTDKFTAVEGDISKLQSEQITTEQLDAKYATIANLNATNANVGNLSADHASFKTTTTNELNAVKGNITELSTKKLDAEAADIKYANIDFSNIGKAAMEYFYAQSGLIKDVQIGDATIAGELIGVTIKGGLIEGNTIVAEKLVIKGEDGLYYKLNTDGVTTEAEQTDYNSLNGSVITAKSITASKITVDDLVAFDATISGLHLTDGAIYSGVKESVNYTTDGFYLDKKGQMNVGGLNSYIKTYLDSNGSRHVEIKADSIALTSGTNIGTAIANTQSKLTVLEGSINANVTATDALATRVTNVETTANGLKSTVSSVQTTANSAASAAAQAQSTADTAQAAANDAINAADTAQSSANTAQSTADSAMTYALRSDTVDLSDTTVYDENTYYPVAGTNMPYDGYRIFQVNVQLNSGTKPSWSTHNGGFSCNLSAKMKAHQWGTVPYVGLGWIEDNTYLHCERMPAYITQATNISRPIFYLRGGGKYFIFTDYEYTWTPHTTSFTWNNQTFAPVTDFTTLANLVYLTETRSELKQLSDRITANVTETTNLGTRMSTVEQTASGLTVQLTDMSKGSINLIRETKDFTLDANRVNGWQKYNGNWTFAQDTDGFMVASVSNTGLTANVIHSLYSSKIPVKTGDKIVMSAWIKIDVACDYYIPWIFEIYNSSGTRVQYQDTHVAASNSNKPTIVIGEWMYFYSYYTVTHADAAFCSMRLTLFRNGTVSYKKCKVEFGTYPTAWSAAPDDTPSNADVTTAQSTANNAQTTADSALARTTIKDTRTTNQNPKWYMTNYPRQTVVEFKDASAIGVTTSSAYCSLETIVPWGDKSGGYPRQVAKYNQRQYWREGISDTAWGSWVDAYGTATNAAKTATNFLSFDSTNGLLVGNKTSGSWSGFRTQMTSNAFNILNAAGTVLASYGASLIELGKNAVTAVISLCGGKGTIRYGRATDFTTDDSLCIESDNIHVRGSEYFSIGSTRHDIHDDGMYGWATESGISGDSLGMGMYCQDANTSLDPDTGEWLGSWNRSSVGVNPEGLHAYSWSDVSIYAGNTMSIDADCGLDMTSNYGDNNISFRKPDGTCIGGRPYGVNQVLWSGALHMHQNNMATLNGLVSEQPHGIVVIFTYYDNATGTVHDTEFSAHFVPKELVRLHPGAGQNFFYTTPGVSPTYTSCKRLFIFDGYIAGYTNNTLSTTSGITVNNQNRVLRYVIGV